MPDVWQAAGIREERPQGALLELHAIALGVVGMTSKKPIRAADLFCGAGGTSKGLALACEQLGIQVDLTAINHWDVAIATHKQNHPWAKHLLSKIEDVDPTAVVPDGRLDLLVASPECTHFSVARGGKPKEDQKRASPWVILPWLSRLYVKNVLIENVPEFRSWGPLGADGQPLKKLKGQTYQAFLSAIRSHGYTVDARVLNSADYGDATSRKRLFIMARRGNKSVRFPTPTHSKGGTVKGTKPWRAAREIIDWSLKGTSIFNRDRPLAPATVRRIIAGLEKFGGPELKPFLVVLRGTSSDQLRRSSRSLERPIPSPAAGGEHLGVAQPFLLGHQNGGSAKPVGEPAPVIHGGRGPSLVEPYLVQKGYTKGNGQYVKSVDEPIPTVTGRQDIGLVEPAFTMAPGSQGRPQSVDGPLPTIVGAASVSLTQAHLMHVTHGGRPASIDEPLATVTAANRGEQALVEAALIDCYGPSGEDDSRIRSVDDVVPTILGGGNRVALARAERQAAAHLQTHFGERKGQKPRVHSVAEPLPATTSRAPQLVEAFLANYHGQSTVSSIDSPLPTIDTRDRLALVQPVIDGVALEVYFRMLTPAELANAMGFGQSYIFNGNRGDAVRQIGNAVAVNMAKALCSTLLTGEEKGVEMPHPPPGRAIWGVLDHERRMGAAT